MGSNTKMTDLLIYWIEERYSIFIKKENGDPWPWTRDSILKQYRFCNVFREDDKETRWIHTNWMQPNKEDPYVWFNVVISRLLNWHESLEELKYSRTWNPDRFISRMHTRSKQGKRVFNSAYIVSTNGVSMDKIEYLAHRVLTPIWKDRKFITVKKGDSLESFYSRLARCVGMGSFMTAQVIADIKHVAPLNEAEDWYVWAASGPGSRRGLNRILDRDVNSAWTPSAWIDYLHRLHSTIKDDVESFTNRKLDCQNLQNCLCEFDKYMRTKNGEGRPKSLYRSENIYEE